MKINVKRIFALFLMVSLLLGSMQAVVAAPAETSVTSGTRAPAVTPEQPREGHRVLISGSHHDRIAIVDYDGTTIWETSGLNTLWSEANDADLLPNGNIVYAARNDFAPRGSYVRLIRPHYPETTGYDLVWEYKVPAGAENHTSQALPDGGVLVGESYAGKLRIVELNPMGDVRKELTVDASTLPEFEVLGNTHANIRQIHKTADGHYLLTHMSKECTVELDGQGKLVRTYEAGGFTARKCPDGSVLVSGGDRHYIRKFDAQGKVLWTLGQNDVEGISLGFPAAIEPLANGNFILSNWGGHGGASGSSSVMEINPETKKVVWFMNTADGGAISNVQLLDGMDLSFGPDPQLPEISDPSENFRSPIDAAASYLTGLVYIADHTNRSVQVIQGVSDTLVAAIALDDMPTALLLNAMGSRLYVAAGGANGRVFEIDTKTNKVTAAVSVGHTPSALALSSDEKTLYVANRFSGTLQAIPVVEGSIEKQTAGEAVPVTREPMAMVLAAGKLYVGSHLPTGTAQDRVVASDVVVVDPANLKTIKTVKLTNGSNNLKDMAASPDGKYIYVTHIVGRYTVAASHVDRGWVNTNAVTEIRTADDTLTGTALLDDLDMGASNPWGVAVSGDTLVATASGTRELIVVDRNQMRSKIDGVANGTVKVQGLLESVADIADDLSFLSTFKTRINLGQDGPRGVAILGNKVYTANYFAGSVSVVNLDNGRKRLIRFETSKAEDDVRAGERLWNDATMGFQQWESCASCHPDARSNGINWDEQIDGSPKQARTMLDTFKRGRVMSTAFRSGSGEVVRGSVQAGNFPEEKYLQLDAYIKSLRAEPSPYLVNGKLSESAQRGKLLFDGKAGCAKCHQGEIKGADLQIYNFTQQGKETRGFLVPPIREVWRTAPYLYEGRAATIRDVLTTYNPVGENGRHKHGNVDDLSAQELDDLIEYVLSNGTEENIDIPTTYTVRFLSEDGKTVLDEQTLELGAVPQYKGETPVKEGNAQYTYTFAGWTPEVVAVSGNATYTAVFSKTVNRYDITWKNGDAVLATDKVAYGQMPAYTGDTPEKEPDARFAYVFTGWEPEVTEVTGNAVYTAVFSQVPVQYTVTWMNGDEVLATEKVDYGKTPVYKGETPVKEGDAQYSYTFAGWEPEIAEVTGDVTYRAVFSRTVNRYDITWKNGDKVLAAEKVAYGEMPAYKGETPVKAGNAQYSYTFAGWEPQIAKVTGDAVYTAKFTETVNQYTVTWKNGDKVLAAEKVAYGEMPAYKGETPVKAGNAQYTYTFAGWEPQIAKVTGDAVYTAKFTETVNQYTVTWKNGDKVLATEKVAYGEMPAYKGETPVKAADDKYTYTFAGWEPQVTAVTEDAVYTAVFTEKPVEDKPCDGGENCPSHNMTDVNKNQWYHEAVDYVIRTGLMKGVSDTSFKPEATTNRAMIVTILYRLEGEPKTDYEMTFQDVKAGEWFTDPIRWAAENGIVAGHSATKFSPMDPITREQMAAILFRYAKYKNYDVSARGDLSGFADAGKISPWAREAMEWANGSGLINGMPGKVIVPGGYAKRCQVAAILQRFCESLEG